MSIRQLWEQYHATGALSDRNAVVLALLPYIHRVANEIAACMVYSTVVDVDDLIQEAVPAVIKSMDRYDPTRGTEPQTFFYRRIFGGMLDALRRLDWVPRDERQQAKRDSAHAVVTVVPLATITRPGSGELVDPDAFPGLVSQSTPYPSDDDSFWRVMCAGLSKTDRIVFLLYWRDGLTMSQIGAQIGRTESAVSVRMSGIMQRLRTRMSELEELRLDHCE